jgi:hypothetical protein
MYENNNFKDILMSTKTIKKILFHPYMAIIPFILPWILVFIGVNLSIAFGIDVVFTILLFILMGEDNYYNNRLDLSKNKTEKRYEISIA